MVYGEPFLPCFFEKEKEQKHRRDVSLFVKIFFFFTIDLSEFGTNRCTDRFLCTRIDGIINYIILIYEYFQLRIRTEG